MKSQEMGKHLLLEVYDVEYDALNDYIFLKDLLFNGIMKSKSKILNTFIHEFNPQGCTIIFALAESHVSLHTWPEKGCLSADFYTCGDKDPKIIANSLITNEKKTITYPNII